MNIDKEVIAYIACGILAMIVFILIIVVSKKKKEGFSAAQKIQMAARYAKQPNALMPSDKRGPAKNQILLPLNNGSRGDNPMAYLLPSNGVEKEVAKPPIANVSEAPPVVGGTEIKDDAPDVNGVALNVTTEDAIKAGANNTAGVDFHDKSVAYTEELPAVVQKGVVDEPAKEGFCGGNTRVCPPFIANGSFIVQNKLQKGGISTNKEGFRPSRHNL